MTEHGEYGPFGYLRVDPLAQLESSRPFAYLGAHSYRKIDVIVRMELPANAGDPRGPLANAGDPRGRGGTPASSVAVTAQALSHSMDADGFYLLGARIAHVTMPSAPRMSCLYVTLNDERGYAFPLQSHVTSVWETNVASVGSGSSAVPVHFCLHPASVSTGVISIPPVMRTPVAIARAEASLTGFDSMRMVGCAVDPAAASSPGATRSVSFHRPAGMYINTPLLRRGRGGDGAVPPMLPMPTGMRAVPTDWYAYVYTHFWTNRTSTTNKSAPAATTSLAFTEDLWVDASAAADVALGMDSFGDVSNGGCGSLINLRVPSAKVMSINVQPDVTPGLVSMVNRAAGSVQQLYMHIELFVLAFASTTPI
jgi:hypothetical protein